LDILEISMYFVVVIASPLEESVSIVGRCRFMGFEFVLEFEENCVAMTS